MNTADVPQFAELVESNREPTRAELAALMRRYLVGAVDDATVERLHEQFHALLGDEGRQRAEIARFAPTGVVTAARPGRGCCRRMKTGRR